METKPMYNRRELWQKMHETKTEALKELQDKKYGMFIHFGLYSMLAGEWKGKKCDEGIGPNIAEWIMNTLRINRDEYSELAKTFDPKDFNGEAFALLAKKAGMKYIMLTSKHHDGFCLFHSKYSDYTMENTMSKRDLVQELYDGCKKHGIDFCLYYSHVIDWYDGGDGGRNDYENDKNEPYALHSHNDWDPSGRSFDDYVENKAIPQIQELVSRYPDMKYIWYDVPTFVPQKYSYEFYKCVYDISPKVLVSHRVGNNMGDIYCPGDNKIIKSKEECSTAWETVGTMNNSWGFKYYDHDWKYPKEVLFWLVEIISKGGNYVLNIGPDQTGNIPKENIEILSTIGDWIKLYGDAIYGTSAWDVTNEGVESIEVAGTEWREENGFNLEFGIDQFWFTKKDDKIYCISQFNGTVKNIKVKSLKDVDVKDVKLLSSDMKLDWKKVEDGVEITFPTEFVSELGFVIEVTA